MLTAAVMHALSRIRTCDDCCPSCRALAAFVLGEPTATCDHCGFPLLPGLGPCLCERFIGQSANPASEQFKALAGAAA